MVLHTAQPRLLIRKTHAFGDVGLWPGPGPPSHDNARNPVQDDNHRPDPRTIMEHHAQILRSDLCLFYGAKPLLKSVENFPFLQLDMGTCVKSCAEKR